MPERYTSSVLENRLKLESRWGQPCCAYNLHIGLEKAVAVQLSQIQESLLAQERSLLKVPEEALHISVAWLLPVHENFALPKPVLWQMRRDKWEAVITDVLASVGSFEIAYDSVIATDSAVIALANPVDAVNLIRLELARSLAVPWAISRGQFVHTTLFRYSCPLVAPSAFLAGVAALDLSIEVQVREILLVREEVFPSLKFEIVGRYLLELLQPARRHKESTWLL